MFENLDEKAYQVACSNRKISPLMFMRKFKLNIEAATELCQKVWLRQHLEARKLAASLPDTWDAQMDRVKLKNLEKIRKKKEKG
jgi:hypothetical protein